MIAALTAASLLISERGFDCNSATSCPDPDSIREAVYEFEGKRLGQVAAIWIEQAGPDGFIIGPSMLILDKVDKVRCVNEGQDEIHATCSFRVSWGRGTFRESFIADFESSDGKWTITDAKSVVEKLKD